jgi:hypothetical protein
MLNQPKAPELNNDEEAIFEVRLPDEANESNEDGGFDFDLKTNFPHLKRVVGVLDKADEEFVMSELTKYSAMGAEAEKGEVEKTEKEIELIAYAEQGADEILFKFGGENLYDIPLERVHLSKGKICGSKEIAGYWNSIKNSVLLRRQPNKVKFVMNAFHEIVHSKVYNALQVIHEAGEKQLWSYRCGLEVSDRDGAKNYFGNVNESIMYELEKIFFDKYVKDNISFSDKEKNAELTHGTARDPELRYGGDDANRKHAELNERLLENFWKTIQNRPEYSEYKNKEDVKKMIIRSAVTGDIMRFGRLFNNTYGSVKTFK